MVIKPGFPHTFLKQQIQRLSRPNFLKFKDLTDMGELWIKVNCCYNIENLSELNRCSWTTIKEREAMKQLQETHMQTAERGLFTNVK